MNDVVIRAAQVGKKYRIRHNARATYTTLRETLVRRGRQLLSIGTEVHDAVEDFWALKDLTFEIRRGEVVGIIGRNGAGKSTLLKILSRITEPTAGRIELEGRVASLLEVGTGFHPELTGRENIFLNGSILGMSSHEMKRQFDQIVAFAGIETFLDTPVKRYSSGMYVRLAFAVAAHMEPEILIVDEVLAVGDFEFQRKCIGKMHEVSTSGRTVLFVSHNMAAIKSLTSRALVLANGRLIVDAGTEEAIAAYVSSDSRDLAQRDNWGEGTFTKIIDARMIDDDGQQIHAYEPGQPLRIEICLSTNGRPGLSIELFLCDENRSRVGLASTHQFEGISLPTSPGEYRCVLRLSPIWLASGRYSIDVLTTIVNSNIDHLVEDAIDFDVAFSNPRGLSWDFKQSYGYGTHALLCLSPADFQLIK